MATNALGSVRLGNMAPRVPPPPGPRQDITMINGEVYLPVSPQSMTPAQRASQKSRGELVSIGTRSGLSSQQAESLANAPVNQGLRGVESAMVDVVEGMTSPAGIATIAAATLFPVGLIAALLRAGVAAASIYSLAQTMPAAQEAFKNGDYEEGMRQFTHTIMAVPGVAAPVLPRLGTPLSAAEPAFSEGALAADTAQTMGTLSRVGPAVSSALDQLPVAYEPSTLGMFRINFIKKTKGGQLTATKVGDGLNPIRSETPGVAARGRIAGMGGTGPDEVQIIIEKKPDTPERFEGGMLGEVIRESGVDVRDMSKIKIFDNTDPANPMQVIKPADLLGVYKEGTTMGRPPEWKRRTSYGQISRGASTLPTDKTEADDVRLFDKMIASLFHQGQQSDVQVALGNKKAQPRLQQPTKAELTAAQAPAAQPAAAAPQQAPAAPQEWTARAMRRHLEDTFPHLSDDVINNMVQVALQQAQTPPVPGTAAQVAVPPASQVPAQPVPAAQVASAAAPASAPAVKPKPTPKPKAAAPVAVTPATTPTVTPAAAPGRFAVRMGGKVVKEFDSPQAAEAFMRELSGSPKPVSSITTEAPRWAPPPSKKAATPTTTSEVPEVSVTKPKIKGSKELPSKADVIARVDNGDFPVLMEGGKEIGYLYEYIPEEDLFRVLGTDGNEGTMRGKHFVQREDSSLVAPITTQKRFKYVLRETESGAPGGGTVSKLTRNPDAKEVRVAPEEDFEFTRISQKPPEPGATPGPSVEAKQLATMLERDRLRNVYKNLMRKRDELEFAAERASIADSPDSRKLVKQLNGIDKAIERVKKSYEFLHRRHSSGMVSPRQMSETKTLEDWAAGAKVLEEEKGIKVPDWAKPDPKKAREGETPIARGFSIQDTYVVPSKLLSRAETDPLYPRKSDYISGRLQKGAKPEFNLRGARELEEKTTAEKMGMQKIDPYSIRTPGEPSTVEKIVVPAHRELIFGGAREVNVPKRFGLQPVEGGNEFRNIQYANPNPPYDWMPPEGVSLPTYAGPSYQQIARSPSPISTRQVPHPTEPPSGTSPAKVATVSAPPSKPSPKTPQTKTREAEQAAARTAQEKDLATRRTRKEKLRAEISRLQKQIDNTPKYLKHRKKLENLLKDAQDELKSIRDIALVRPVPPPTTAAMA